MIKEEDSRKLKLKAKALNELAFGTDRMIAGEYVDTEFEGQEISKDYLEYMHNNKTGALIKASVRIGAILAGASESDINKLTKYAEKIGLAFQIRDDILSEIGDEKIIGKPVGNDRRLSKVTFVTKYGLKEAMDTLENITEEALEQLKEYRENGEFLRELALYIKNREK